MIKYLKPDRWIQYDPLKVMESLVAAKAAIISLKSLPYQKSWAEQLQKIQIKREVAGTSRIEGADFTEEELTDVMEERATELETRSLRQADAARRCYAWISTIPPDAPLDKSLILHMHSLMVKGADDDHCPIGRFRNPDENVLFGSPQHRGVQGGPELTKVMTEFLKALNGEYKEHDPAIQALAAHYHLAAMHPFLDGNGRTVRAMEAVMLRRAEVNSSLSIAMSNYYYEEKANYLEVLSSVRAERNDLTSFLVFGLKGIEKQCLRLSKMIGTEISKALYVNMMTHLFKRMTSTRKRALAKRQMGIGHRLLERNSLLWTELYPSMGSDYQSLKDPKTAFMRDVNYLIHLGAINWTPEEVFAAPQGKDFRMKPRLEWPTEITDTEFFEKTKTMPKSKGHTYLATSVR